MGDISELPTGCLSVILGFLDIKEFVYFGNQNRALRIVTEDETREILARHGWKFSGEYPITEYLEIMSKSVLTARGVGQGNE